MSHLGKFRFEDLLKDIVDEKLAKLYELLEHNIQKQLIDLKLSYEKKLSNLVESK